MAGPILEPLPSLTPIEPSSSAAPVSSAAPIEPSSSATPLPSSSAAPLPSSSATPLPSSSTAPLPSSSATPLPSSSTTPSPSSSSAPLPSSSTAPSSSRSSSSSSSRGRSITIPLGGCCGCSSSSSSASAVPCSSYPGSLSYTVSPNCTPGIPALPLTGGPTVWNAGATTSCAPTGWSITLHCSGGALTYSVADGGGTYTGGVTIFSTSPFHAQIVYTPGPGSCCGGTPQTIDITA